MNQNESNELTKILESMTKLTKMYSPLGLNKYLIIKWKMRKDMKAGNYDNSLVCNSVCMYVCTTYALIINNKIFQNNLNHILSKHLNSIRTWGG